MIKKINNDNKNNNKLIKYENARLFRNGRKYIKMK